MAASAGQQTRLVNLVNAPAHLMEPGDGLSLAAYRDVFDHLRALGMRLTPGGVLEAVAEDKQAVRKAHLEAVVDNREKAERALRDHEAAFVERLAVGNDIEIANITPRLVSVGARTPETLLWRWITLHWSIPTSTGYGRRLRYIVVDAAHGNAVIGAIGLGDAVFALGARDEAVGWTRSEREDHLHQLMDAFVLGAVPPYSSLIGGKLVALLATSERVRKDFRQKYDGRVARISGKRREGPLAAITTTSALGRSSVYNRLQAPPRGDRLAYLPVGYTSGSGDFQFHGDIYRQLREFVARHVPPEQSDRREGWGGIAYRNRREVITRAFDLMGVDGRKMRRHGIRREVFIAPLTNNWRDLLSARHSRPSWRTCNYKQITDWWLDRWAIERAHRCQGWRDFNPDAWRIWVRDSSWLRRS